ncbi:MAG: hypothetical protein LUG99_03955 [Lachnospiraceae bacterium]|nr:hypothetical protein [Lachnospiraceae bacterium]
MAEKRIRRSKKDIILDNIAKLDEKIGTYEQKIQDLEADKQELQGELEALEAAANEAKKKEEEEAVLKLIREKGITADDIKKMLEKTE